MAFAANSCGTVPDRGRPVIPSAPQLLWSDNTWPLEQLNTAGDARYLSRVEKEVILHLNMVRTDPARYADRILQPRIQYYNGLIYRYPVKEGDIAGLSTEEGKAAVYEAISALHRTQPRAPLAPSRGISRAAAGHASFQSVTGELGHMGRNNSTAAGRVEQYGDWHRTIAENINYGPNSAREIVAQLLIDDGVKDRGHRANILNPDFRVVGVAIQTHPEYGYVCVIDFAGGFVEEPDS